MKKILILLVFISLVYSQNKIYFSGGGVGGSWTGWIGALENDTIASKPYYTYNHLASAITMDENYLYVAGSFTTNRGRIYNKGGDYSYVKNIIGTRNTGYLVNDKDYYYTGVVNTSNQLYRYRKTDAVLTTYTMAPFNHTPIVRGDEEYLYIGSQSATANTTNEKFRVIKKEDMSFVSGFNPYTYNNGIVALRINDDYIALSLSNNLDTVRIINKKTKQERKIRSGYQVFKNLEIDNKYIYVVDSPDRNLIVYKVSDLSIIPVDWGQPTTRIGVEGVAGEAIYSTGQRLYIGNARKIIIMDILNDKIQFNKVVELPFANYPYSILSFYQEKKATDWQKVYIRKPK
jgi:hypothetical protein